MRQDLHSYYHYTFTAFNSFTTLYNIHFLGAYSFSTFDAFTIVFTTFTPLLLLHLYDFNSSVFYQAYFFSYLLCVTVQLLHFILPLLTLLNLLRGLSVCHYYSSHHYFTQISCTLNCINTKFYDFNTSIIIKMSAQVRFGGYKLR